MDVDGCSRVLVKAFDPVDIPSPFVVDNSADLRSLGCVEHNNGLVDSAGVES